MTTPELLADDEARRAVVEDLDRTLFVEAGAGSGKTTCLVNRFVALVKAEVPADQIAAITFTERAARELVDHIRTRLEDEAGESPECAAGLDLLDRAAIGTLHSFAQRILNEHPIEAGLPPRVQVLDEIASQVAFANRWELFLDALLDDPTMARPLRLLLATDARLKHLRDVAEAFDDNWDLVVPHVDRPVPPIPVLDVDPIVRGLEDVIAQRDEHCRDGDDRLAVHVDEVLRPLVQRLRTAADEDTRFELLGTSKLTTGGGSQGNWKGVKPKDLREQLKDLQADCEILHATVTEAVLQQVVSRIARFTRDGAEVRRRAGELEFHDLLVLARQVLRHPDFGFGVRRALAGRYQRLLLDEFQDTDPIQIDLAVLLASDDPEAGAKRWQDVVPEPGRLFFVGDPKQSIYRFRRADIATFLDARDSLVGESETLTRSYRTVAPVVEWVNRTFAQLIQPEPGSQPEYLPLQPDRGDLPDDGGPGVAFVGRVHGGDNYVYASELREAEAADVAAAVCAARTQRWQVRKTRDEDGNDVWRDPRWDDMAILLPARTSLPFLEKALERAGVPYRAETSSLVYGTREVRDLMMIARAVDDPTNELAIVAALRTPGLACGDDDLFTWKHRHKGGWDHQRPLPDDAPADHPVAQDLRWLGALHHERLWLAPSHLLERIVRERRLLELAVADHRPRDLWRRLRFVLDQARAWEEAGGVTLRQYLRWVEGQSAEGARVVETVLPETDDDAVRILTVHGAKGLEFPIVVLSGMTTALAGRRSGVEVRFPEHASGWAVKIRKGLGTMDYELHQPLDEQLDGHERLRLLYVAATRAQDHLVVSVHRRKESKGTAADLFVQAGSHDDLVNHLELDPVEDHRVGHTSVPSGDDLPSFDDWQRDHDAALAQASKPLATSATRLAQEAAARREEEEAAKRAAAGDAGLAKGPNDLDQPPWQKGRYGTAIGRAVHGVLQTVDLATGDGLDDAVAAQAAAEGVEGKEGVIKALCQSALDSDIVKRAAVRPHWREVYVGVPHGDDGGILEGYIDLLYRDDDGLVIVDYKTDARTTEAELDAKVERYAVQMGAYAAAVRDATSLPVASMALLFASLDRPARQMSAVAS